MDARQRLAALVLLIYMVPQSHENNVTSNATLILLENQTLPFQKEKDLPSIIKKEEVVPSLGNLEVVQTSRDVIESPSVINDQLLSLLDQHTQNDPDFYDRQRILTVMDQASAESRTQSNSVQQLDLEDIDNLEDVVANTEYEPQKINSDKAKGKSHHNFEYTAKETTTQPFDKTYHKVPRKKGIKVLKYGTTKESYNIRPTEKSRHLASENYPTPPSIFDPTNGKTKLRSTTKNSIISTTSDYLLPTTSPIYSRVSEIGTTNYNNAFTTLSLPNYLRSTLSETKILDKFVEPTTIFPNIQTLRSNSAYSPASSKFLNSFANFDEGTTLRTIPIATMTTNSFSVPSKKSKRKKAFTGVVQDSNVKNVELSLQDKARQSRALNHTDGNYKFGLLAKYDVMPRPFALHAQDQLNAAATRTQSKSFEQPQQVFPTNPSTLWNFNTEVPTLSTISRKISNPQRRRDSLNSYLGLRTKNIPFSTFTPYTNVTPPISSNHNIRNGYVPPPRRTTSRGRARYTNINKSTEDEVDTKDFTNQHYPATSANKIVSSIKVGHYKTHETPDEGSPQNKHNENHDKKKESRKPHHHNHRDEHHHRRDKHNHIHNRHHDREERHHPKDKQDDGHHHGRSHKLDRDHKQRFIPNHNQHHENDNEDKYDNSHDKHSRESHKHKDDHHNDEVNEEDHHHSNKYRQYDGRNHHQKNNDKEENDQNEQDEDHDHSKKLHDRDIHYDGDDENTGESTQKHEHKHNHKKEGGDHKYESGGGTEHEGEHHSEEGEKGDKGYESRHENEKAEKGYHDKEDHNHYYDEKKGDKKKHEDEDGYHMEHHFGEKGEKDAEFGEKGEHQSGHNIKGKHFIHKKDEYEKKTEFFDEFHDEGDSEKEGEFHHEHKGGKGGHHKSGHHDEDHHEGKHGKEHHHLKGNHLKEDKGHKEDEGHEEHYHHEEKHGKKGAHEEGKKWAHKKGK